MKQLVIILLSTVITCSAAAQYEREDTEPKKGFKKENLFTGGSVTASFYSGGTTLGLSPYFGYSLNRFVDVAASVNFSYTSQRDVVVYGDKARQIIWGPGAFVRLYPVKFLFAQGQFERSFVKQKYLALPNSGYQDEILKMQSTSFLIGGGYCSGRQDVGDIFYYFSVLWDIGKDINSPYVDGLARPVPVIRAGLQIPLFQGGRNRRY